MRDFISGNYDGDSSSQENSVNRDIEVNGDSNSPIKSVNGEIEVNGDSHSTIKTVNGNIEVSGNSNSSINSVNGKIKIGGDNKSIIFGENGKINVLGKNLGKISNNLGDIKVGSNLSKISSDSGNIKVESNSGEIETVAGKIQIGKIVIDIKKDSCYVSGNSVNQVISNGNSVSNISGRSVRITQVFGGDSQNVSVVNGKTFINGVEQTPENKKQNQDTYTVTLDGKIVIDYNNKKVSYDGTTINIEEAPKDFIRLVGNTIEANYLDQIIEIGKKSVKITGNQKNRPLN